MRRWLRVVLVILWKEWLLEWRGRELPALLICNALMISILVGAGVSSAALDHTVALRIYPMLLWIVHLLSTTASAVRSNEQELEARGFEGLLLAGATGSQMFIAKVFSTWVLLTVAFVLSACTLAIALDQNILPVVSALIITGAAISGALSSLIVLLIAVSSTSKMRGALLPLIMLPLCFPLFFAGIEITSEAVTRGNVDLSSPWPSIIVCANVLYFLLGLNLFDYVVRD